MPDEDEIMNKALLLCVMTMLMNIPAVNADIATGQTLSAKCMGCHGAMGKSANPAIPSIAGKDIAYLQEKLHGYRDGSISNPVMKGMAGGLSDADIESLAAYYNSLPN
jgi:cytochrome c553